MNLVTTVGPYNVVTVRVFGDYRTTIQDHKTGDVVRTLPSTNDPQLATVNHRDATQWARVLPR